MQCHQKVSFKINDIACFTDTQNVLNVYFLSCFPEEYNFQMESNLFSYSEVTHNLKMRMTVKKFSNILERKLFKKHFA